MGGISFMLASVTNNVPNQVLSDNQLSIESAKLVTINQLLK